LKNHIKNSKKNFHYDNYLRIQTSNFS